MNLLVDMNLSPRWIPRLASAGIQATHWSAVGKFDAADAEIMAFAAQHDQVVPTHDLDFSAILAATRAGSPSVVQIRSLDLDPDTIGHQLVTVLRQLAPELEAGALVTIDPSRTRVRLLPLRPRE